MDLRAPLVSVLVASSALGCRENAEPAPPIRVAAASDLTSAFEELGREFEQRTGGKVSFSFGSSGLLAKQLRAGAPFDVFAAANVAFVDEAVSSGACDGATKAPYARGHLAIWTRRGSALEPPKSLEDLADGRFRKIAIANPEHAPYGMAAREALISAGIWERVKDRIVLGENVRQTLQLAETGNAEAALVALSLVVHDERGAVVPVDPGAHRPIEQALVVCRRGANSSGGKAFAEFVNAPPGRAVLRRYGLILPGERMEK